MIASHRVLIALVLLAALVRAPFFFAAHAEGDEQDANALVRELGHGRYSLAHVPGIADGSRTHAYANSRMYVNPPLFHALGFALRALDPDAGLYVISYFASLCTLALVYLTARRLGGEHAGIFAALLSLLCPITLLTSGKLWVEPLQGALAAAVVYVGYRVTDTCADRLRAGALALTVCLSAALALTKQSGLAVVVFAVSLHRLAPGDRKLRQWLWAAVLGAAVPFALWQLALLWVNGRSTLPVGWTAAAHSGNEFVRIMAARAPWSFFTLPLLLMPLYAYAFGALPGGAKKADAPLVWFFLATAAALTALATAGVATFHMKYLAFALPALAVAAGHRMSLALQSGRRVHHMLCGLGFAYAASYLPVLVFRHPGLADIDPRFVYPVLRVLPW